MLEADNPPAPAGQSLPLVIVGGGVMGLFAALEAGERGLSTVLLDAGPLAGAASNGLIGALMPHMPDRWSEKKQFQFDALLDLEQEIARLEGLTGLSAGFRRSGRLVPLGKPHLREIALRHSREATVNWQQRGRSFAYEVVDDAPEAALFAPGVAAHGFVRDTLAARLSPRALARLLVARLAMLPTVTLRPHTAVSGIEAGSRCVRLADGSALPYGRLLVANGHQAFALIETLVGGPFAKPLGQPVKGQSARLGAALDPSLPVIFRDGLYVIAHDDGTVAVGSTSEDRFDDPHGTDAGLDAVIEAVRALMPVLREAPVLERWAGLRPKAIGRDPMAGPLPGVADVHLLAGGFKVSFGLAHRLARAVIARLAGDPSPLPLPEAFAPATHLTLARGG